MSRISSRVRMEYTPGRGLHFPETIGRGRPIFPSYSDGGSFMVTDSESVSLSIPIGSIAANGSSTVSGSQQLNLSSLNVAGTDLVRVLFTNISATGPANVIISHPQVYLSSNQGNVTTGQLISGNYTNLSLFASVPCFSIVGSSAGTVTITATMIAIGTQVS